MGKKIKLTISANLLCGIYILFFIPLALNAKSNIYQDKAYVYAGKWKANGGVQKLYKTPLGAVYRFTHSEYFDFSSFYKKDGREKVYCLQFDLPESYKNNKTPYRFIVIDFKIRSFPAISEIKFPKLVFSFTRSLNNASSILVNSSLNGFSYFETGKTWSGISTLKNSPYWPKGKKFPRPWNLSSGARYLPHYGIASCRIIFDIHKDGVVSTNINGTKFIKRHNERTSIFPFGNSFGICLQHDGKILPKQALPRELLEVSSPKITLTNNENDLQRLKPVEIVEYPYSGYPAIKTKIKNVENPDWLYAYAMELLKGKDLVKAVEVLKTAAKKEHIFAMYQLGVCYYRGLGVETDMKKAVKWVRKAAKYSMTDALALLGLLAFRQHKTVYMFETDRKLLTKSRYAFVPDSVQHRFNLFKGSGKHDNWIIASMFYSTRAIGYMWLKSPKLALWIARNTYIKIYYKDTIDPDLKKKKCKAASPPKPWVVWVPATAKKLDDFEHVQTVVYPRGFKKPLSGGKLSKRRRPWSKFYEIRVDGLAQYGNAKLILEEAVKQEYLPAILYRGRLYAERENNLKDALKLFKQGEKLGSLVCALDILYCQARLGKLQAEDFSDELNVKFADYPLYYMLRYMVKNPDAPGVKEFLAQRYENAREIWRKKPSPWNNFLLGAEALYQYFNYGFDTAYYRIYWGNTKDLTKAFEYLDKAAKANIVPAVYLSGKQHLEGMRCRTRMSSGKGLGVDLLLRAVKAGHIKAQYLLIKHRFESSHYVDKKWLKELAPIRKANFADAWLLSTDIYAKLNKHKAASIKNLIKGYKKAAKLGSHRAWDRLARLYYYGKGVSKDKEKAAQYWGKFVECDQKIRNQDFNDIYWSKLEAPIVVSYDEDGLPVPRSATTRSKKVQKHYFSIY